VTTRDDSALPAHGRSRVYHLHGQVLAEVLALNVESPEEVRRRLDMTPSAIAKAVRRSRRPDLAPPFERLARIIQRQWQEKGRRA